MSNLILGGAHAYITGGSVTGGNVSLAANNTASITATANTTITGSGNAFGFVVAFNTIGWNTLNLGSQVVDALVGDNVLGTAQTSVTEAYVHNAGVTASGTLSLNAHNHATINATAGSDTGQTSAADFAFSAGDRIVRRGGRRADREQPHQHQHHGLRRSQLREQQHGAGGRRCFDHVAGRGCHHSQQLASGVVDDHVDAGCAGHSL